MLNGDKDCHGNFGHCGNGLTSGRPILRAEDQFLACHFSPSQFVPFRKIGRRQLKEILRMAATSDSSDKERSFKVNSTLKEICIVPLFLRNMFRLVFIDKCPFFDGRSSLTRKSKFK